MVLRAAFIVVLALAQTAEIACILIPDLTEHTWENGRIGYFAVPRHRVAAKLAELQQNSCHGEFLTVPTKPVLQDLIHPEEHVVAVVYGKLGATSFEESLPAEVQSRYETQADTVQFYIPMLTGTNPNAEPSYKLSLGSFVATDKPFLQPNVAIPTEQVDRIDVSADGLVIINGTDRFEVKWSNLGTCEPPEYFVIKHFHEYEDEVTVSSQTIPIYPFCDEPGGEDFIFCVDRDIINCACQVWTKGGMKRCREDLFSVEYITPFFAQMSLLTDGPQDAVVTEFNDHGHYGVGVQQPCVL